jgi:hypothetical protein
MAVILWTVIALGVVGLAVVLGARHARTIAPLPPIPTDEPIPTAPMQRAVRWSLVMGLLPVVVATGIIVLAGPTAYSDDDATRILVTVLLLIGLIVLAAPMLLADLWSSREDARLDERDRAILGRAPTSQAPAMLVLLAVWTIALQEAFRGQPGIPEVFLNLMFWSCALVSLVASNVATLISYQRG